MGPDLSPRSTRRIREGPGAGAGSRYARIDQQAHSRWRSRTTDAGTARQDRDRLELRDGEHVPVQRFGQGGGSRHAKDEKIAKYRNRWLDVLLLGTDVTAVIMLGSLAATAFSMWAKTQPQAAAHLHQAPLKHPTFPESASASGSTTLAKATADLHTNWNGALDALVAHVIPDVPANPTPYAGTWQPSDLVRIPERDLPAGSPGWWCDLEAWAQRPRGVAAQLKRATITVTVPTAARTWPPLP